MDLPLLKKRYPKYFRPLVFTFLADIEKDLENIDKHYVSKTAKDIKKKMIELILNSM